MELDKEKQIHKNLTEATEDATNKKNDDKPPPPGTPKRGAGGGSRGAGARGGGGRNKNKKGDSPGNVQAIANKACLEQEKAAIEMEAGVAR